MTSTLPLLAAGVLLLAAPAAAHAGDRVGQDPDGVLGGEDVTCAATCTIVPDRNANLDIRFHGFESTTHGVVVEWRVRASGPGARARVRRAAITAGGVRALPGGTPWTALAGTTATQTFPARLKVEAGDALALDLDQATLLANTSIFADAERILAGEPALADGETRALTPAAGYVAFDALVEPDCDADGLGDETQDAAARCGGPPPPGDDPGSDPADDPGGPPADDPYRDIRGKGPAVTVAPRARLKGGRAAVVVVNPHAVPLAGTLELRRGKRRAGKAKLALAAGKARTVKVKVKGGRPGRLTARATLKAAEGPARTTTAKVAAKRGPLRIDGRYKGRSGGQADWVAIVKDGVVENFNGSTTLYCADSRTQRKVTFGMFGDDPDPRVGRDGAVTWEATKGYGFLKLKYTATVAGGALIGDAVVEERRPISGADPVTGLPRIEFDYCFAGQDFALVRR